MKKTILVSINYKMYVQSITKDEAIQIINNDHMDAFDTFYIVKNSDNNGCTFFVLGKGHIEAPTEICGWYYNSKAMWFGYGKTIETAIEGMIRDGWLYA